MTPSTFTTSTGCAASVVVPASARRAKITRSDANENSTARRGRRMARVSYPPMTAPGPPSNPLFDRRVLVVSGKGGAGKTSVAAACAMAASRAVRSVLLVEVEGRDGLAGLLGIEPPGFNERDTPFGLRVLSITPREALRES